MNRPLLALVTCGLALGCATAPAKPPAAAEPKPGTGTGTATGRGATSAILVARSPLRRQLEDIAPQVAEEVRGRMKGQALDEKRAARVEDALARLWSRERLIARVEWSVRRELEPAEAMQVWTALSSPLAERLLTLALEHDRSEEVDEKEATAFTRALDQDEARVKRVVRFLEAIGLIEGLEISRALAVYGGVAIANEAGPDGKRTPQKEIQQAAKRAIEEGMPEEEREQSAQATLLSVAYALRKVSDAELEELLAFWEGDLARKYRKALHGGFILAVQVATGQTMQMARGEPLSLPPGMEGMDGGEAAAGAARDGKRGYSFPLPAGFRELHAPAMEAIWSSGGMVLVAEKRPAIPGEEEAFLASIVVVPVDEPDRSASEPKRCAALAEAAANATGAKVKEAGVRPNPRGAQCRYVVEDPMRANRISVGIVKGLGPQWIITCNLDARDAAAMKACGEADATWSFDAR